MRRNLAALVLAVLVAVDAVLILLAVQHTRSGAQVPAPTPSTGTPSPSTSTTSPGDTSPSPTSSTSATPTGKVIVAALNDARAWRASTEGPCRSGGTPATFDFTRDGGATWTTTPVPLVTVSAMSLVGSDMVATGLDSACRPATYSFSSSSAAQPVSQTLPWAIAADSDSTVQIAGTSAPTQPCADGVLDIGADSTSYATVLCAGGTIERTRDSGATWSTYASVPGAVAIATDATHTVYVVTRQSCGLAVAPAESSGSTVSPGCVDGSAGATGPVDLSISGGTQWLVTGTKAWRTPLGR